MKTERYGTKEYAARELRLRLRVYAAERRKVENGARPFWADICEHAQFLGAWGALVAVGALTQEQANRAMDRSRRISHAAIGRRPLKVAA